MYSYTVFVIHTRIETCSSSRMCCKAPMSFQVTSGTVAKPSRFAEGFTDRNAACERSVEKQSSRFAIWCTHVHSVLLRQCSLYVSQCYGSATFNETILLESSAEPIQTLKSSIVMRAVSSCSGVRLEELLSARRSTAQT